MLHFWNNTNNEYNVIDFCIKNESNIMAEKIKLNIANSTYNVKVNDKYYDVTVPIAGEPFIYNSLCAICVGRALNIDMENIITGIKKFELTKNSKI